MIPVCERSVNQFQIFSVTELSRRHWLRRSHMLALLALGWLGGTLMSQARDADSIAPTPLNRAVADGRLLAPASPTPVLECPQLSATGLRLDCRLSPPTAR
ncbi:MAG: hypothetical protein JWQ90_2241 [Hydrocarboniphaga sp.]|uniref:hypothetical protein n=1 Tax=Hydrocarboniphaga sp. TaxID=2033016 RepID=UPI00263796FF|nr:hypothetical protein [Hydrocarboniphaga sp.]MDB5969791.1 hypothetical protein [Hydrocarboniphaga sp.]